jgi:3-oxoacyl-[acyl-carrier protein] reductase
VLITGSSRGIGRAIAKRLAENGWTIALHYNNTEKEAREIAKELGESVGGVYQSDLSHPEQASDLINQVVKDGPIHALVNNAGIYQPISFQDSSDEDFLASLKKTFAVNLESPIRLIRTALPEFKKVGGGKVLNVASRVGFKGEAGAALYAASKAALINLTRSLAVELTSANVGVFGIAPGWVDTAMARDGMDQRLPEILSTLPLGRMASVEDCAAVASFLLSDDASYLSGQVIDINGASYFH